MCFLAGYQVFGCGILYLVLTTSARYSAYVDGGSSIDQSRDLPSRQRDQRIRDGDRGNYQLRCLLACGWAHRRELILAGPFPLNGRAD